MHLPAKSVPLALACAFASLALAACGGSGSKVSANTSQNDEQQIVNFTRCLREHGVSVSTPNGPGGGQIKVTGVNPQLMEAAQKACARYRPGGGKEKLSPAERARREDQVREFARCMRSHGIELQTQTSNGALRIGIQGSGIKPESPAFQAAQKACQGYLPKLRPAGRIGPGPGSGGGASTSSSGPPSGSASGPGFSLNAGK